MADVMCAGLLEVVGRDFKDPICEEERCSEWLKPFFMNSRGCYCRVVCLVCKRECSANMESDWGPCSVKTGPSHCALGPAEKFGEKFGGKEG